MPNGWCEFAIRCEGPPEKTGYRLDDGNYVDIIHAKVGVAVHCAEYESTPEWDDYKTLHNALFSDREASWTFSICDFFRGAILYQHYPIGTVCWAQGYQGNLYLDSIEIERIAPHKLTDLQYALLVKTLRWIKEAHGWVEWVPTVGDKGVGLDHWIGLGAWLFEHNAVPGAPATDCAVFTRGQVDPQRLLRDLKQEEDMTQDWHARRWPSGLLRQAAGHCEVAAGLVDHAWSGAEYTQLDAQIRLAAERLQKAREILRDNGLGPETGDWKVDTF